jgi:hypothetical protein
MLSAISGDCLVWASIIVLLPRRNLSHLYPRGFQEQRTRKLREQPIAGGLENAAAMLSQQRIDHIASHGRKAVGRPSPQLIRRRPVPRHHCAALGDPPSCGIPVRCKFFRSLPAVACSALVDAQRAADLPIAFARAFMSATC